MTERTTTITLPISGLLFISHLAAYGLAKVIHESGASVRIGHRAGSLECEPVLTTVLSVAEVGDAVRASARGCERVVEADLEPGKTGNNRRSVIWARNTDAARAAGVLALREALLDETEAGGERLAAGLLSGLGAPSPWLDDRPHRGASALDGVLGNHTSDFVRGVLRKVRPVAGEIADVDLIDMWIDERPPPPQEDDKTQWAPRGTRVHPVHQWLAALGLAMLPVGLTSRDHAHTPCVWRRERERGVRVPILTPPVSAPRLRGLLQRRELVEATLGTASAGRLRALGIHELVEFSVVDRSTPQSVAFSFGRGMLLEL